LSRCRKRVEHPAGQSPVVAGHWERLGRRLGGGNAAGWTVGNWPVGRRFCGGAAAANRRKSGGRESRF